MEFIFMLGRIIFFPVLVPITFLRAWFTDWEALEKRHIELNGAYAKTYGPNYEIIRAIGLDPPEHPGVLASSMGIAEIENRTGGHKTSSPDMKIAHDLLAWEEQVLTSGPDPLKLFVRFLREYRQLNDEGSKYLLYERNRKWAILTNLDARERRIRGARAAFVMAVETYRND